jgi:hypothetical protein
VVVRCGTNGECGRVGDRDPWMRVGARWFVAWQRERISEIEFGDREHVSFSASLDGG